MASDQETPNAGETPDGNEVRENREREASPGMGQGRASEMDGHADASEDTAALKLELKNTREALKKINAESAQRRKRLQELEDAQAAAENAKLGETERLKRERDDLARRLAEKEKAESEKEAEIREMKIRHAIEDAAREHFEYPDLVPGMIDRDMVEIDPDTGKVKGAKEAVEKLFKERPGLGGAKRGGGTPLRDTSGNRRAMNGGVPQSLEERTKAEFSTTGRYRQF
jgi:hypothetical protein